MTNLEFQVFMFYAVYIYAIIGIVIILYSIFTDPEWSKK